MKIRTYSCFSLVLLLGVAACSQTATPEPATEAPEPTAEPAQVEPQEPTSEPESSSEVAFALNPESSEVRFVIGEILNNQPNTVVAVNREVQGGGVLNFEVPSQSILDTFVIDASGFVTDSGLRDRAIRQFILQSGQFPTISFEPTNIDGIPDQLTVGESASFQVTGLLTIRNISQETAFVGEATMISEDRIEGFASATIFRADFELGIPSVPRVASVDEEVILEIEFVAQSQ